jgi:hypothetical protein
MGVCIKPFILSAAGFLVACLTALAFGVPLTTSMGIAGTNFIVRIAVFLFIEHIYTKKKGEEKENE